MSRDADLAPLLRAAAPVLCEALRREVTLHDPVLVREGPRSRVVRAEARATGRRFGSFILKEIAGDGVQGFTDWASLSFLSRLGMDLVPRFYGGDLDARVMVLEDLGGSRSLDDLLNGSDRPAAMEALRALAMQMARLHGGTVRGEAVYEGRRRRLPGWEGLDRREEARTWLASRERMLLWFEAAGCPVPAGFDGCLQHVAGRYAEPGPFLTFTHGDPAPTNNHVGPGGVRLLDFEYGGYRHALYDLTGWNVLCSLPAPVVEEMGRCYRYELETSLPIARDDACYGEAWGCLCAYRALAILTWIPPDVLRENRPWVDRWTAREAILSAVARLRAAAVPVPELEPLAEAAGDLEAALRRQWPGYGLAVPTPWRLLVDG